MEKTLQGLLNSLSTRKKGFRIYNRSFLYLLPYVKLYGKTKELIKSQHIVTCAIGDNRYNSTEEASLFIVFELNGQGNHFLERLRNDSSYYIDDYPLNCLYSDKYHVVVFKFANEEAIKNFKAGFYSKMYKGYEMDKIFDKEEYSASVFRYPIQVLRHTEEARERFENSINNMAESIVSSRGGEPLHPDSAIRIFEDTEYDFAPQSYEEKLNFFSTGLYKNNPFSQRKIKKTNGEILQVTV